MGEIGHLRLARCPRGLLLGSTSVPTTSAAPRQRSPTTSMSRAPIHSPHDGQAGPGPTAPQLAVEIDWRLFAVGGTRVTPALLGEEDRIEVDPLLREPVLEPARVAAVRLPPGAPRCRPACGAVRTTPAELRRSRRWKPSKERVRWNASRRMSIVHRSPTTDERQKDRAVLFGDVAPSHRGGYPFAFRSGTHIGSGSEPRRRNCWASTSRASRRPRVAANLAWWRAVNDGVPPSLGAPPSAPAEPVHPAWISPSPLPRRGSDRASKEGCGRGRAVMIGAPPTGTSQVVVAWVGADRSLPRIGRRRLPRVEPGAIRRRHRPASGPDDRRWRHPDRRGRRSRWRRRPPRRQPPGGCPVRRHQVKVGTFVANNDPRPRTISASAAPPPRSRAGPGGDQDARLPGEYSRSGREGAERSHCFGASAVAFVCVPERADPAPLHGPTEPASSAADDFEHHVEVSRAPPSATAARRTSPTRGSRCCPVQAATSVHKAPRRMVSADA